ncbi:MAG TPA: hypothetical protein VMV26_13290 [Alphaproteobacteria bacterium]|jgi:hypothetical protein|nr:hypothetical protein [Alphaproteobacteria bacterium]
MANKPKARGARRTPDPEIEENARAGRHADQHGAGRRTGPAPAPAQLDDGEKAAYRAERDKARAEGRMQGTEGYDMGHYHAAGKAEQGSSYPPGFNWGPRSGYAEEQVSGAPYNLSRDGDSFLEWRERRLQELDRAFLRWRAELSHQLDDQYKRWIDAQQQAFTDDLQRWQGERRAAGTAPEARGAERPSGRTGKRSGRR